MKNNRLAKFAIFALAIATLAGCARPSEGNFLVVRDSISKKYADRVNYGFEMTVLDDAFEIYGRDQLLTLSGDRIRPKDSEGVMVQNMEVTIVWRNTPEAVIPFVRKYGDMTNKGSVYVVGENFIRNIAESEIGEVIKNYKSEALLNEKTTVSKAFSDHLQKILDEKFGQNTFVISEVRFANVLVAPSVEERMQAVALINAEKVKADATMRVLETRENTQLAEMQLLKRVSEKSGVSVDQILEARRLDILRDMPSGAATVVVNSDSN